MARTIKLIEAPRLKDLVTRAGTTKGLTTLVNEYLATLVNPIIRGWSLDVRFLNKRMDPQWMFTVISDDGGAALATPFTLRVDQATSLIVLETALNAFYVTILVAGFTSVSRVVKLDSDEQGFSKQYVAASLINASAGAANNYIPTTPGILVAITDAQPVSTSRDDGTSYVLTGWGFLSMPLPAPLYAFGPFDIPPIDYTVIDDNTIITYPGVAPAVNAVYPAPCTFKFLLQPSGGPDVYSPDVSLIVIPPIPTLGYAEPPGTQDIGQQFVLYGTNLSQVTQVTVQDDATAPSYWSVPFTLANESEIVVPPGPIQTMIDGGSVVPFSFRFRIWDFAAPRDFSAYIPVDNPPPPVSPMADAAYASFTGSPQGKIEVVGVPPAIYELGYNQLPIFATPIAYGRDGEQTFTFAVWFRRVLFGPMLEFATGDVNTGRFFTIASGGSDNLNVQITPGLSLFTPAASFPDDDMAWHLIVLTCDGTVAELYFDGNSVWSQAFTVALGIGEGNFTVGRQESPGYGAVYGSPAFWWRTLNFLEVENLWTNTIFPP